MTNAMRLRRIEIASGILAKVAQPLEFAQLHVFVTVKEILADAAFVGFFL